ncbi:MAG TPA: potassium transporter Kup [Rhizomicrobium sp.]|jgi:KUP system potassium uptake protein|nr:potassium transporter Kup [Rhizomicrobium sp.]
MNVSQSANNVPAAAPDKTGASARARGHAHIEPSRRRTAFLTLGALGVVFGDIGTSPFYAMRESVRATGGSAPSHFAILAAASMIFWSLVLVVTVKYVFLIMRADNDGEGGVLALAALAHRSSGLGRRLKMLIGFGAILGLALFFGDGMLTPAITVLSAVEYVGADVPRLVPLIVPLTVIILVSLFAFQNRGTAKIGRLFGPIMLIWFAVLAVIGFRAIIQTPEILWALSPYYAIAFFIAKPVTTFVSLGAVVLAVTGCEALYADMGHFGKQPIRYAWLFIAFPALVLAYFGQAGTIMRDPRKIEYVFYAGAPAWAHFPLLILALIASIIASQAVISGVYSITQQAVQLGQLPRMEIRHTSATDYGQIFVPLINIFLCIGVVLIVLIFRSSDSLAAAYGIAVTGVMVISTMLASIVALRRWKWRPGVVGPVFGLLALVDLAFLGSNSLKIIQGGWLPLLIAAGVFIVMETWRSGRRAHLEKVRSESMPLDLFLERADKTPVRVAGTAVFLSPRGDVVPGALLHNLKHNKVLHERVVLAHVVVENTPTVSADRRLEVTKLGKGFFNVFIRHGFFETPDVPRALESARPFGLALDVSNTTFFIGRETLVPSDPPILGKWRTWLYMRLVSTALSPVRFYRLPANRVVEMGTQVTI